MGEKLIYLDNAATSFPKPEAVIQAMTAFMREVGGNPGRSGHRLSIEAGRVVFEAREKIAALFGISDSSRVIFGQNATEAINLGLKGLLRPWRPCHHLFHGAQLGDASPPGVGERGYRTHGGPLLPGGLFGSGRNPKGNQEKIRAWWS